MQKDWLVQAAFPDDVYHKIKIQAAKWRMSIKAAVLQLVIVGLKSAK
jgi:hypothetical protein